MVYEWHERESECYRLYVEERRSLDEVMQLLKDEHGFTPSKRAFQTQFRRWGFPSKQHPAWKNEPLVARVHQLWEQSTPQKEMLAILQTEGYDIKDRELMRLRARHRWFLRGPNVAGVEDDMNFTSLAGGLTSTSPSSTAVAVHAFGIQTSAKRGQAGRSTNAGALEQLPLSVETQANMSNEGLGPVLSLPPPSLEPEIQHKRQERLAKLSAESDEQWAAKKRRRRTRGWAGLPADPPGPPRFPSETTIDESKAFLHLDNDLYHIMRSQFSTICEESNVIKKTTAGPEKWQAVKDRLVRENEHLQNEFFGQPNEYTQESKSLALDVLCLDVTKRLRTLESRMTIAQAKTLLEVNPAQVKQLRNSFTAILSAEKVVSKLAIGEQRWRQLKQEWVSNTPLLQRVLNVQMNPNTPLMRGRMKALDVLSNDIMKRLREEQGRIDKDPNRTKYTHTGPGPGPAKPVKGAVKAGERTPTVPISPALDEDNSAGNSQVLQAIVQHMQSHTQTPVSPSSHSYRPAVSLPSQASSAEVRLRQSLQQHANLHHHPHHHQQQQQQQQQQQHHNLQPLDTISAHIPHNSGQIDPFLLAVANSNEWADKDIDVTVARVPDQAAAESNAAQRLQEYAASASTANENSTS